MSILCVYLYLCLYLYPIDLFTLIQLWFHKSLVLSIVHNARVCAVQWLQVWDLGSKMIIGIYL